MREAYNNVEGHIIGIIKAGEKRQVGNMCQVYKKEDTGQKIALPCFCGNRCKGQSTCWRGRIEVEETDSGII